jgi:hypothetical protein
MPLRIQHAPQKLAPNLNNPMKHLLLTLCLTTALHAQQPAAAPHTFTSTDGRKLTATVIEKTATSVTLRRAEDGKDFILQLDRLSAADQAFVKAWGTKPAVAAPLPAFAEPKVTTFPSGLVKTWMLEPQWDGVGLFGDGLAPVKLGGKWGYIDETGKMIIEPAWDEALSFADGLAPAQKDDKWGYIDKTGKVVVELTWDDAEVFFGGVAIVVKNGKFGFIDATGKVISEAKWASVGKFTHGLAVVHSSAHDADGSVAIINLKGETIFEQPRRKNSPPPILISEHGISVIDNRPYNAQGTDQIGKRRTRFMDLTASKVLFERPVERHIDHTGNFVTPPASDRANDFQNGMAFSKPVNLRNTHHVADQAIIDTTGAVVVPRVVRPLGSPRAPGEAIPAATARHYGLVNHTGKIVATPAWEEAKILSPDLVAFWVNGKFGLVNATGQTVLPATAEKIEVVQYHDEQSVKVRQDIKWGLLEIKTGKISPTEGTGSAEEAPKDKTSTFPGDFVPFEENKLWGVKAKDGTVLVAAQYGAMKQASKDRFWVNKGTEYPWFYGWGLMTQTGQILTEFEWDKTGMGMQVFSDGLVLVNKSSPSHLSGFMDGNGKLVVPLSAGTKSSFAHGAAMIWSAKGSGLINTKGEWLFKNSAEAELSPVKPFMFYSGHFQHGLALIETGVKWGFVKITQAAK